MPVLRSSIAFALLALTVLSGCTTPQDDAISDPPIVPHVIQHFVTLAPLNVMNFTESIVTEAVGTAADLYEPTMEVSNTGTIYVAGHVIGAATTGTPAYYSNDDGASWTQLPFAGPASLPGVIQGSTPPPGDEGFIVAGDNGEAWMADIYAAGFTVNGWCDNGASACYDNRYAYDRASTVTSPCNAEVSLNDRPWAAYGGGKLLLVNNPGGGPMQIGVMDAPPATPVGLFGPVTGPVWNLCASPDGWIPGIPAMRADGFFAVPQMQNVGTNSQYLGLVTGNASDIFATTFTNVFDIESGYGGTSNGGRTAFDGDGVLYVGAYNNTDESSVDKIQGRFIIALSQDDGMTFTNVTFATDSPVRSFYLDSHLSGPGALVTWSQLGSTDGRSDWYVAHVNVGPGGEPVLSNISLAVNEGPHSSAHVMGASAGPDGRAYFVTFEEEQEPQNYAGSNPIRVWVQQTGPTLEVRMAGNATVAA